MRSLNKLSQSIALYSKFNAYAARVFEVIEAIDAAELFDVRQRRRREDELYMQHGA